MPRKIAERQLTDLFGHLRAIKDWGDLEQRLAVAIRRNATATAAEWGERRDPLHDHTVAAVSALEQAVVSVQALRSRLDAIDHLSDVDDHVEAAPGCWMMAKVGVWEPVHRTANVGGRLKEARPLGKWAYDFVGSTDELPTREQARAHAEGRRVRVKA